MASLSELFGTGSIAEQFLIWGVLNQLASGALAPAVTDLSQAVNSLDPVVTLSPEQLAVGVIRGLLEPANSASEAAKSGISAERFTQLQQLAQTPADLGLFIAAYQREVLGSATTGFGAVDYETWLTDLGINPLYHDLIRSLAVQIPPVQQVMQAWLQGQIEEPEANARYLAAGGDPSWFQTSYNAQGEAPTPNEALEMLNRGLITQDGTGPAATTFEQAFLEGPWRNKWETAFLGLRYYVPPPRTVTALLKEGAITTAEATTYLQAGGLDENLTAIYIAAASHSTTAAQRELTQAQIIDLYESKLITAAEATADLVALRFSEADATLLLALADQRQAASAVKSAVSRLQTLFLDGANTATQTTAALHTLGLTDAQVTNLLATWQLETASKVKTLTAAEIASAFYYGAFTQATAEKRLMALGYSLADADIVLTIRTHSLLPGQVAV